MDVKQVCASEEIRIVLERLVSRPVYVAGGPVRDVLLGRPLKDLDLTVPAQAKALAQEMASLVPGAKFVVLHEEEGVIRVVFPQGFFVDLSEFRKGATTIEEDLFQRDFTVNALAVPLKEFCHKPPSHWQIIDPTKGRRDLEQRLVRAIREENLADDPLRLLRAYRLAAELNFSLEDQTRIWIRELASRIWQVAPERIGTEIRLLFEQRAGRLVSLMAEDALLFQVFPELKEAQGVAQPSFHHLDVLGHLLLALEKADEILEEPTKFFGPPPGEDPFRGVISSPEEQSIVRLAALFHDLGKPRTFALRHRITFYEHDRVGAELFGQIGERLRFSKRFSKRVARLIRHHMRPFHLLGEFRRGRLTKRALRRLIKDVPDYTSLFLVAMADSLASAGPDKEEDLEAELAALFWEVHRFHEETFTVQQKERLVSGRDLIDLFGLEPGPIFRELLEAVEEARVEGKVKTRDEALEYLSRLIAQRFVQS